MGVLKSFSFNRPELEKYFFYTFNVHLLLRGACTTIWAAVVYVFEIKTFGREMVAVSLEMLIGAGCALLAFAFCAGGYSILYFSNATFRNRPTYNRFCITAMFASLFLIILIVQSAAAIHMLVVISEDFVTKFKDAFINYGFRWEDTKFVDLIQHGLHCCGIRSYYDYWDLGQPIPASCCHDFWENGMCSMSSLRSSFGCVFNLRTSFLIYYNYVMGIFTLLASIIEFICLIFALYFANSIRKRNATKKSTGT